MTITMNVLNHTGIFCIAVLGKSNQLIIPTVNMSTADVVSTFAV